jgi:hypothetical protein
LETKIIEAHDATKFNHGKFMLGRFTKDEWARRQIVGLEDDPIDMSLLGARGWNRDAILVLDLQTGEGAIFQPHGMASADVRKHRIWHCPLYPFFLDWLYRQETGLWGYRRPGPEEGR